MSLRSHVARAALAIAPLIAPGAPLRAQTASSDTVQVLAAVQGLFDGMARLDSVALRALLLPESQFFLVQPGANAVPRRTTDAEFLALIRTRPGALLERMWNPEVRIHGPLAEVWTPYDFHVDGTFSHCGVDVFTLFRTSAGWRIAAIAYTVEPTGCAPSPLGAPKR